ncbi:MAG: hypothetical protein ACPH98_04470, partial [Candidatus Puniceispirillales bacterium]
MNQGQTDTALMEEKARLRKSQSAHRKILRDNDPEAAQKLADQAMALITWATDQHLFDKQTGLQADHKLLIAGYWPIRTEM